MVGAGTAMLGFAAWAVFVVYRRSFDRARWLLLLLVPGITLPYIANSSGWIFTEIGRQPWIVFGLQKTADAVSRSVSAAEVFTSLVGFTLLYGVLMAIDIYLLAKYGKAGLPVETEA